MTILTKTGGDKKEKVVPLIASTHSASPSIVTGGVAAPDPESIYRRDPRKMSSAATLLLFLIALLVMCIGIIGGTLLYRQYMRRSHFHGSCSVPVDPYAVDSETMLRWNDPWREEAAEDEFSRGIRQLLRSMEESFSRIEEEEAEENRLFLPPAAEPKNDTFFSEKFDLDLSDDEEYARIEVPEFRNGRPGRFLHDFRNNQTAIIDGSAGRCFIMPLDRERVLPPRSMYDLVNKMWNGYYDLDMSEVKQKMRVVTPALDEDEAAETVSSRIRNECAGKKLFKLEQFIGGVYKREAVAPLRFVEFAGKGFLNIDLVNAHELKEA